MTLPIDRSGKLTSLLQEPLSAVAQKAEELLHLPQKWSFRPERLSKVVETTSRLANPFVSFGLFYSLYQSFEEGKTWFDRLETGLSVLSMGASLLFPKAEKLKRLIAIGGLGLDLTKLGIDAESGQSWEDDLIQAALIFIFNQDVFKGKKIPRAQHNASTHSNTAASQNTHEISASIVESGQRGVAKREIPLNSEFVSTPLGALTEVNSTQVGLLYEGSPLLLGSVHRPLGIGSGVQRISVMLEPSGRYVTVHHYGSGELTVDGLMRLDETGLFPMRRRATIRDGESLTLDGLFALEYSSFKGPFSLERETAKVKFASSPRHLNLSEARTNPRLGSNGARLVDSSGRARSPHNKNEDAVFITDDEILDFECSPHLHALNEHGVPIGVTRDGRFVIQQQSQTGCGAATVGMLVQDRGKKVNWQWMNNAGFSNEEEIVFQLRQAGLNPYSLRTPRDKSLIPNFLHHHLNQRGSGILSMRGEVGGHVVVLDSLLLDEQRAVLRDPFHGWSITVSVQSLLDRLDPDDFFIQCYRSRN